MIYTSAPDRGIYDAMNTGVAMAHGEYCIFMNAADIFVGPQVLTEVVAQGMTADVVYGDIQKEGIIKPAAKPQNSHRMYYCHQAAFTRTQCLRDFPFDISHRMSADFKQSKQLFLSGKTFRHIPVVITAYDTTGISNTRRSAGLLDNIKVIRETDSWTEQVRLLPRLLFTYISCKLRGK
jgi:hypothetical protein